MTIDYVSRFVAAQDGLNLHVRSYGSRIAKDLPIVCLPGLARTSADFDALAMALVADPKCPRCVFAVDYRGRGGSEYDRSAANYTLTVELRDLLAILPALGIGRAIFIGTSRGGILTMLLAAARPTVIAGAILNDIGPVIEPRGLMRIKSYVGKLPQPKSLDDAAEMLRRLFGGHFPALTYDEWLAFAGRTFETRNGKLVPSYDPMLATALDGIDVERPLPALWNEFEALGHLPVMVIRGANSDVLSPETVFEMRTRHRKLQVHEVPDQGHAPLLADSTTIRRIIRFIADCEAPASSG